jgi:hypothetical protein
LLTQGVFEKMLTSVPMLRTNLEPLAADQLLIVSLELRMSGNGRVLSDKRRWPMTANARIAVRRRQDLEGSGPLYLTHASLIYQVDLNLSPPTASTSIDEKI